MEVVLVAVLLIVLASNSVSGESCVWETTKQKSRYTFNLAAPLKGNVHGIRSEDGFFKISQDDSNADTTTFLFQPCEHMKFNHDPPICRNCESCGGPDHCGETCSALEVISYPGYSLCKTLGYSTSSKFSLIDAQKPERGVVVNMTADNPQNHCSFAVYVYCKSRGEELPSSVSKDVAGDCHYTTTIRHPSGCPLVTNLHGGGMGWFSTLLTVLICLFVVYLIAASIYRRTALGIIGWEAVPHMDFWRSIPTKLQLGLEYIINKVMGLYHRIVEPSYVRVIE